MRWPYSFCVHVTLEGCASILWKSADKASTAAEAMGITSDRLSDLGLVDEVVNEPLGGAHRNVATMAADLKVALLESLALFEQVPSDTLLASRYERLMQFGDFKDG